MKIMEYDNKTFSEAEVNEAMTMFTFVFNSTGKKVNLDKATVRFLMSLKLINFEKKPHAALTCMALKARGHARCTYVAPREDLAGGMQALRRLCKLPDAEKKLLLDNQDDLINMLKKLAVPFHCNRYHRKDLEKVADTATVDFLGPVQAMFARTIAFGADMETKGSKKKTMRTRSSTTCHEFTIDNEALTSSSGKSGRNSTCESEDQDEEDSRTVIERVNKEVKDKRARISPKTESKGETLGMLRQLHRNLEQEMKEMELSYKIKEAELYALESKIAKLA